MPEDHATHTATDAGRYERHRALATGDYELREDDYVPHPSDTWNEEQA